MSRWFAALSCLILGGIAGTFLAGPILRGQNAVPVAVAKELTSYRDVVKKVLPAVVSVEARAKPKKASAPQGQRRKQLGDIPNLPDDVRKYLEELQGQQFDTPEDSPHFGFGSGFIVDGAGVILTNFHVVDGADQVEIQLKDGRKFQSKSIKGDRKTDIAIVRIEPGTALPALELGDSDAMEIGDRVLAVGAPFGLTGSVTSGIVSAKGRNGLRMNLYEDFLQTDAAINPGNSGGPLVNLEGRVIGINSAIKSHSGGFQGVGLAIASNMAKTIMDQLLKDGVVRRGYLGIQIEDLSDPKVAARLGVKENSGVVVGQVFDNAPAGKGGVQAGDIVTHLGDKPITGGKELQRIVASLPINKPVGVTVVRDGKTQVLQVTIEEQPAEFGTVRVPSPRTPQRDKDTVKLDRFGLEVTDLTREEADELGFRESARGALITKVDPASDAHKAGLRRGMLIVKVAKQPVKSAAALRDALAKDAPEDGVLFQVQSPREGTRYLVVKPETAKK